MHIHPWCWDLVNAYAGGSFETSGKKFGNLLVAICAGLLVQLMHYITIYISTAYIHGETDSHRDNRAVKRISRYRSTGAKFWHTSISNIPNLKFQRNLGGRLRTKLQPIKNQVYHCNSNVTASDIHCLGARRSALLLPHPFLVLGVLSMIGVIVLLCIRRWLCC